MELGACQLSLPPRRCGRGPSRGEGCPARGVQALVSQAPSCSHSQEPSGPQQGALPQGRRLAPQCLPQGCTPTVCMAVFLCVLIPPTVPSLSFTSGLDLC